MFHLLVALSRGPQHGYGLIERVADLSEGTMRLGAGTLYRTLQRLSAEELVVEQQVQDPADPRRRTYELTEDGRTHMLAELERLERTVRASRRWIQEAEDEHDA